MLSRRNRAYLCPYWLLLSWSSPFYKNVQNWQKYLGLPGKMEQNKPHQVQKHRRVESRSPKIQSLFFDTSRCLIFRGGFGRFLGFLPECIRFGDVFPDSPLFKTFAVFLGDKTLRSTYPDVQGSAGWISAVYLALCFLARWRAHGELRTSLKQIIINMQGQGGFLRA